MSVCYSWHHARTAPLPDAEASSHQLGQTLQYRRLLRVDRRVGVSCWEHKTIIQGKSWRAPTDTRTGAIVYGADTAKERSLAWPCVLGVLIHLPARPTGSAQHSTRATVTAPFSVQPPASPGRAFVCRAGCAAEPRVIGYSAPRALSPSAEVRPPKRAVSKRRPNQSPCGATERPGLAASFHRSMERRARIV